MFDRAVAIVEGYLGDDPVERKTQSGKTKVSLSIGVNKSYKNPKTDEWESSTDWHKIIVVNPNLVEKALKCKKGAYVRAEGNLEKRSYEKEGVNYNVTEVILIGDGSTLRYKNKADLEVSPNK